MRKLVEWGQAKKVKLMISMGGMPVQDRQDIEAVKVYGAASNPVNCESSALHDIFE